MEIQGSIKNGLVKKIRKEQQKENIDLFVNLLKERIKSSPFITFSNCRAGQLAF